MSHIDTVSHSAVGTNLACGDKIKVNIDNKNNSIRKINFVGECCVISKASASLMTEELKGKSLFEAEQLFFKTQQMITLEVNCDDLFLNLMNQLRNMASGGHQQSDKCLHLPWKTMYKALHSDINNSAKNKLDYSVFL
jgi:nitrogen fixation NifU-like protein